MSVLIEQIRNKPINSNNFIIYNQEDGECVIIDPGTQDCVDLIKFLTIKKLNPKYIFLTHEHFDHIWGVNKLKDSYNCKIVCSLDCSRKIIAKKKNMSLFYDQVGFESYPADICTEDIDNHLEWGGENVEFITTEGHTEGSICILINNNLFTGDTIIKDLKTVTKLPGGSKSKLINSFSLLNNKFSNKQIMIYSGHGESFLYDEIINQYLI